MVKLSKRLQAIAGLVTAGNRVCDVGTDHAYIPIYLVQNDIIPCALAMDVNKGPLLRAKEHIAEEKRDNGAETGGCETLDKYIVTRQSDGLTQLRAKEADTIILAGMGGGLMIRILQEGMEKLEAVKELILQPQSDVDKVRRFVEASGFAIEKEDMVFEDGKYYVMFRCIHSDGLEMSEQKVVYERYGRGLIRQNHPLLQTYLQKEEAQLLKIRESLSLQKTGEAAKKRLYEVEEQLQWIREAREEMEASCAARKS